MSNSTGGRESGRLKPGNYVLPPAGCASLEQLAKSCGGSIVYHGEQRSVDRVLPSHATEEVRDFLRAYARSEVGRRCIADLPGGRVFGSGNVLSSDGKWLAREVSLDFGKPFSDHWLLTYKKIPPPRPLSGRTAVIATTLGSCYSHWLIEELPRLLALSPGDDCESLIAHTSAPCQLDAIVLHGFPGNLIDVKRRNHYSCEELIVPGLGELTPENFARVNEFVAPLRRTASLLGERLYVSRARARRRRVTNEPELWAALESHGFVKVYLEELTWSEQITAFHSAKAVVAPHGAGLANLVFCQTGTKVVELFNRSYVNPVYWQLASSQALDYRPLVSAGPGPLGETPANNRLDITADIPQVLAALAA